MTSGTKILLALIGLFVGILVLYYGFLMPSSPPGAAALVRDPALEMAPTEAAVPPAEETSRRVTARQVKPLTAAETGTLDLVPGAARPPSASGGSVEEGARTAGQAAATAGAMGGATQRPVPQRTTDGTDRSPVTATPSRTASAAGATPRKTEGPSPTAARAPQFTRYIVESGDTMTSIAQRWFGDHRKWDLIARANDVDPDRLEVGQVLRLPPRDVDRTPVRRADRAQATTHTIRAGDSLSTLAQAYYGDSGRWKDIYAANRDRIGPDPDALEVGATLRIP